MDGVAREESWKDRARAHWAKFVRWLRPLVTTRADLLRHRLRLGRRPRLRPASTAPPRFFFSTGTVSLLCALWRRRLPLEAAAAVEQAEQICRYRFDLLGYENVGVGSDINWHCDPVHGVQVPRKPWFRLLRPPRTANAPRLGDRRIIWELNRHQHLVTLAKVYRLTGNGKFATEVFCQWRHWHAQNPYPMGVNWVSSREVALRSLSWCWLYFLLADSPQLPPGFRAEWLRAMNVNGRHLERYAADSSSSSEALAEGVALFFIGVLCPELEPAERWKKRGWEIVLREAELQAVPRSEGEADGIRVEQSTGDQVSIIDFFLHACVLASLNQVEVPVEVERVVEKMLDGLSLLGRAGAPPRLGGGDGGRVFDPRRNRPEHLLDPLSTGAILFGRGDFKQLVGELREETLWLLGEQGVAQFERLRSKPPEAGAAELPEAGLYLMANAELEQQLVIDARSQNAILAGQGHAAALSVSLNRHGRALIIDPGTPDLLPAEPRAMGPVTSDAGMLELAAPRPERGRMRRVIRNTLLVQNRGIAKISALAPGGVPPSVKVEAWVKGRNFDLFVGSHNGYGSLEFPIIHRRWVFSLHAEFWLVKDLVLGEGRYGLGLFWHLCPELSRYDRATGMFVEAGRETGLRVLAVEGHGWSQEIRQSWWSPVYGGRDPLHVLQFSTLDTLPVEFVTLLAPVTDRAAYEGGLAQIRQSPMRGLVSGYRYETAVAGHYIFFGQGRAWTLGLWSSDAEFLYWSPSHDGERRLLICCNGSYVEAGGQRVISCAQPALRSEIAIVGERMEVFSSDPDAEVCRQALDGALLGFAPLLPQVQPLSAKRAGVGR
jgi:Heparinase II/III N-terminus/Heparinase II/III-like protein